MLNAMVISLCLGCALPLATVQGEVAASDNDSAATGICPGDRERGEDVRLGLFLEARMAKLQRRLRHFLSPCQAESMAAAVTAALGDLFHIQATAAQKLTGQVNALGA